MTEITFDSFCQDNELLGAWHAEGTESDGREVFRTAREAAAFAVYKGAQAKKRGVIEIVALDSWQAKDCRDYLEAYFEKPLLKSLLRKVSAGVFELTNGVKLETTTNDKRKARDLLCGIRVDPNMKTVEEIDFSSAAFWRGLLHAARRDEEFAAWVAKLLGITTDELLKTQTE